MNDATDYPTPSFRLIALVALCIGIGAGAWAFFSFIIPSISDDGKTVYIQADKSPIKTTPDQPGGMDIPHQDKLVFNSVTPGSKPVPEHLAPPPEQPVFGGAPPSSAPTAAPTPVAPPATTPVLPSATEAGATPAASPTLPAPGTVQPVVGQTDAPLQGSSPQRKVTMPVALGRAIEPADALKAPVAPQVAAKTAKLGEPAASFDFKDGGAPPALPVTKAETVAKAALAKPSETQKLIDQNEVELAQDPSMPGAGPNAVTATELPPPAQKASPADKTGLDDDGTADDADDVTAGNDEDAAPPTAKKSKPVVSSASKPEDEPVTYKPSPSSASRYQLASYTDRASAQRAVSSFGSKYSGLISKSSLTVVAGQANGHQVYRVQGSASSKDEASAICGRVKAKGGSCVIAH